MESVLIHGDCLEKLRHIPGGLVDLVTCDLPYGVTENKWDTPIDLAALWVELLRVGTKRCAFVFTATQPFVTTLINSQPKIFRYDLIWIKHQPSGFLHARKCPLRAHEHMLIFSRATSGSTSKVCVVYNAQKTPGKPYTKKDTGETPSGVYHSRMRLKAFRTSDGSRFPLSYLKINLDPRNKKNKFHPTQKPVALLEWLIKTYSNEGDVVLDPTCGSGTAGVACANTRRHFIGIEKDPTYFEVAKKRIAETEVAP